MSTTIDHVLSDDQRTALDVIMRAMRDPSRTEFVLGGLAGTGKTTIVRTLIRECGRRASVVAPTAKACVALARRGTAAITIHSAIYNFKGIRTSQDEEGRQRQDLDFEAKELRASKIDRDVCICDEASMVTLPVANDLRRFAKFILWVGDHGQLPPVGADPGIMTRPDVRLEKIHRQAAGSGILAVAHEVRVSNARLYDLANQYVHGDSTDGSVEVRECFSTYGAAEIALDTKADVVLVARNDTRAAINRAIRRGRGIQDDTVAQVGEVLVGLRNAYKAGVMNGEIYTVVHVGEGDEQSVSLGLRDSAGAIVYVQAWRGSFGKSKFDLNDAEQAVGDDMVLLDYAYALTVHKAQGSEWNKVLVVDEVVDRVTWDNRRWAYTAATRAAKSLLVTTIKGR